MPALVDKPHLIHIGFPKCASTYLQDWFEANPQIAYRPGGFAGMHSVYHFVEALLDQSATFRLRVTSAEQLSLPIDPAVYGSADPDLWSGANRAAQAACDGLFVMFPDAHILLITRGFESVLRSGYSQMVRMGTHALASDFEGALDAFDHPPNNLNYDAMVAMYREHFGERVIVLPYELLQASPRAFLQAIEEPFGLEPFDPSGGSKNPSLRPDELYWYPRLARLLCLMPIGRLRVWLQALHVRMIAKGRWRPLLSLLSRVYGKRDGQLVIPRRVVETYSPFSRTLLTMEHYKPFADAYSAQAGESGD